MAIHRPTPPTPPVAPVVPGVNDGANTSNQIDNNSPQSNDGGIHIQVNLPQGQNNQVAQPAANRTAANQATAGDHPQGTPENNASVASNQDGRAQVPLGNPPSGEATETTQETATAQPLASSRNSSLPAGVSIFLVAICMIVFGVWVFKKLHPKESRLRPKKVRAEGPMGVGSSRMASSLGVAPNGSQASPSSSKADKVAANQEEDKAKGSNFEVRI